MNNLVNKMLKTRHKLVRTWLRLMRDPDYKSKSDCWPWIRLNQLGRFRYEISFSGSTVCTSLPLSDFNETVGDIAIIGSGPSVKMMDFEKISTLNCVLLNGAITLAETYDIKPLACIIVDSTFIENRFDTLRSLPSGTRMILAPGVIRAISERNPRFLSDKRVYLVQNILKPVYDPGPPFSEEQTVAGQARFSFNLNCGFVDGGTVMAVGMQLAHQIKVRNTYLIGLDINNFEMPRFYETEKNKLKCGLARDYQRSILPFMMAASGIFRQDSLSIYNCSPVSKLPYEIIPYCDDFCAEPQVSSEDDSQSGIISAR